MKLLREPLLHFLVAGAALFGIYGWLNRGEDPNAGPLRQVHISEGDVSSLRETWARQWQREPTAEELRGAVRQLLNEELLALEAHDMRLDENDTIVRRRLAQKLNFVIEGTTRLADPTEHDLQGFYASHADQFRTRGARVVRAGLFQFDASQGPGGGCAHGPYGIVGAGQRACRADDRGPLLAGQSEFHDESEQVVSKAFGRSSPKPCLRSRRAPGAGRLGRATGCTWCVFQRCSLRNCVPLPRYVRRCWKRGDATGKRP